MLKLERNLLILFTYFKIFFNARLQWEKCQVCRGVDDNRKGVMLWIGMDCLPLVNQVVLLANRYELIFFNIN